MKVLVTNAEYGNALAAVRSLGKRGVQVVAGSEKRIAQCSYSKYTQESVRYPSPGNHESFVRALKDLARSKGIDVILPIGYDANVALSRNIDIMKGTAAVPVAPWESMEVASDKARTMDLAKRIGIDIPRTYGTPDEVDQFPVVVKGALGSGMVWYANDLGQLRAAYMDGAVIQEYIPGDGYGFFALFNHGEPRATFMHRRLREFPITGGASSAAVSVRDDALNESGMRILEELKWHGVAMAEFKKDSRDGRFKLIEVNPKFWGSLDLSVAAGVDFPYLCAQMAAEGDVAPVTGYKEGVKFRWVFPQDLMHAIASKSLAAFVSEFFDDSMMSNIDPDDIAPNLVQLLSVPFTLKSALRTGSIRHPHGQVVKV